LQSTFQIAHDTFDIPLLLDPDRPNNPFLDKQSILCLLFQLLPHLKLPSEEQRNQRLVDISRFQSELHSAPSIISSSSTPSTCTSDDAVDESFSNTTMTSTFTMQQLRITKTTVMRYSDGSEVPTELQEFESRCSLLMDKFSGVQHRMGLIIPTRSTNYTTASIPTSATSDSLDFLEDTSTTFSENETRVLHPLQAGEEDYATYDRNFKQLQSEFQTLVDGEFHLLQQYADEQLSIGWREHPNVDMRLHQLSQLNNTVSSELDFAQLTLAQFRRGYAFARMCASIRLELDQVQNRMVKSITTNNDIEELESRMDKTSAMVTTLEQNFGDLLLLDDKPSDDDDDKNNIDSGVDNDDDDDNQKQLVLASKVDPAYRHKFDLITKKNQLVQTWVEEVRVWFAEAQRIGEWIDSRIGQLESITIPEALASDEVPATQELVESLNAKHSVLGKEIEQFDKEDMTRLRTHVKTLTGSGRADKDLSPADTTTIEITLKTLTQLDKLTISQSKKSVELQLLTQRVAWEEEYAKAMAWLKETDAQVDEFLSASARWTPDEQYPQSTQLGKRDYLMAKEKQKETIVQQLLTLERKMAEFDQGQFTKTVDSFQDLDNTSTVELPAHLEDKQGTCEQFFEDLMKRMAFSRNVVEQRLNMMDFLYQNEMVIDDVALLQMDLTEAEAKAQPGDNDRDMTARVQTMHERVVQLVTAVASRIPYPVPGLAIDSESNTVANQEISDVVSQKRDDLISLSEDLDHRLFSFRNILQLHRRAKEHMDDANRLSDWAEERVKSVRKARAEISEQDTLTLDDLHRLEREREALLHKLKNGKENEVVDLLTRIQLLLETVKKLKADSIDREGMEDISHQLEERFDRLQQILEEEGLDLEAMRKKMEDGNTYSENARALRAFMSETRHSFPSLKQTCGFMTGQSEEQDKGRYDMLNQSLANITASFKQQQSLYNQLCSHFNLIEPSKIENLDELESTQHSLEHDWNQLSEEIKDLGDFAETVRQWYNRQRRLSMVEAEMLSGLNEEISQLAKAGWTEPDLEIIQTKLDKARTVLNEIGEAIRLHDTKEDPLQTANYSCARDRHAMLLSKLNAAANNLKVLRTNASKAVAFSAFLSSTDRLLNQVQIHKENVGRRMTEVGETEFASNATLAEVQKLYQSIQAGTAGSEADVQKLQQQLGQLRTVANDLATEGYETASVMEPLQRIRASIDQLVSTLQLEKKQAMFVRKIQIHAKAAQDLQTWMDHCGNAISQLPTDVCMNEEEELMDELDSLEQKMIEMRPTIQAFEVMEPRIFATKDGHPLDLCELSLDRNKVRESVKEREKTILDQWSALKNQHAQAKGLVANSKRGVEIARKVKAILQHVGDMKDRVNVVRICRNTQPLDEGIENRDLMTVLSCPLTSFPTEHRLASAKAELSILERDIDANLYPSIDELDTMISSNSNNDDIFTGQRAEITAAVRGLADLLKTKRKAIAEAEKMEGFLTVSEELEVLLLALAEVVARASPEEARIVDGNYSRSDLQALLIDLDTRFRYYEPKINDLMDESKQVAKNLMDDRRVVECLEQFANKWSQLQTEAAAKKAELLRLIGPLGDTFDILNSSAEGMLKERGRKAANLVKRSSADVLKAPAPQPMQSTPRYMTGYNRTPATTPAARKTPRTPVTPASRRVAVRKMAAQQTRQRAAAKTPEAYVADPKNDLDVALGDIVNDSPYKIQVKMVPGEVGKYWFGDANPKLAYCRILRSRMVMVRVGGGWVELSQFLRDHALLEGGHFVPRGSQGKASLDPVRANMLSMREGFINTTGSNRNSLNGSVVSIRGGGGQGPAQLRESRSTPYHGGVSPFGHGIKSGNKFLVTVDGEGNRVEVKMTKAKSKDTKFVTPRRMNI
jgi:hypothetical protein